MSLINPLHMTSHRKTLTFFVVFKPCIYGFNACISIVSCCMGIIYRTTLKRGYSPFCASVLLITKVGHQIYTLSKFRIFRTFFELKLWFTFIYKSRPNQKSVRYSFSKSYFTNIEFQNVNKAFVRTVTPL